MSAALTGVVVGAGITAVTGLCSALLGYRGTRAVSERHAVAVREQWTRQQRRDAYVEFFKAGRNLYLILRHTATTAAGAQIWQRSDLEATQAAIALGNASSVLAIEASQKILDEADALRARLDHLNQEMADFATHGASEPDLETAGRTWSQELDALQADAEVWLKHCREELHRPERSEQ